MPLEQHAVFVLCAKYLGPKQREIGLLTRRSETGQCLIKEGFTPILNQLVVLLCMYEVCAETSPVRWRCQTWALLHQSPLASPDDRISMEWLSVSKTCMKFRVYWKCSCWYSAENGKCRHHEIEKHYRQLVCTVNKTLFKKRNWYMFAAKVK